MRQKWCKRCGTAFVSVKAEVCDKCRQKERDEEEKKIEHEKRQFGLFDKEKK